jgi:hypothetical protein
MQQYQIKGDTWTPADSSQHTVAVAETENPEFIALREQPGGSTLQITRKTFKNLVSAGQNGPLRQYTQG